MKPNHQRMSAEAFHAFAEQYVAALSAEELLAVPGVAVLVLEDYNNTIIQEIDELDPEDITSWEEAGKDLLTQKPEERQPKEDQ